MAQSAPEDGPGNAQEEQPWHDAGVEADYRWQLFITAQTPLAQARALVALSDAMSDLRSWLPGYDSQSGTMPWEREDAEGT